MDKIDERRHAEALLRMLERPYPCDYCPYSGVLDPVKYDMKCKICREFIGIKNTGEAVPWCPCFVLGKEEALKHTWIVLESKGYI